MRPYGVRKEEYHEPFVKIGDYGRYKQTKTKLGYKAQCKQVKSRARFEAKKQILNFNE